MNYNEINLYDLESPVFNDEDGIFQSNVNGDCKIKSTSLRLISINDNLLTCEFLYDSNEFYQFILRADDFYKKNLIENGVRWFGNSLNQDNINNIFKGSVKLPNRLPSFPQVSFVIGDDCVVKNRNKKFSINQLSSNMEIELDLTIDSLKYYKNKCYLSYIINKINVVNRSCQVIENLFQVNFNDDNINSEIHDITASTFN